VSDASDAIRDTSHAIRATLISEADEDPNGEPANVVDGLFAIARALESVAKAIIRAGGHQ
jgi:hypothetical protein